MAYIINNNYYEKIKLTQITIVIYNKSKFYLKIILKKSLSILTLGLDYRGRERERGLAIENKKFT